MELLHGNNSLFESDLKEPRLEEEIDESRSHLKPGGVEEEELEAENVNVTVEADHIHVVFVLFGDVTLQQLLFKVVYERPLVSHDFEDIGRRGAMWRHNPVEVDERHERSVQEVEVSDIGPVLRYFLDVAVDIIDALASVALVAFDLNRKRLEWVFVLVLFATVDPDQYAAVYLFHLVGFELRVAFATFRQIFSVLFCWINVN